MRLASSRIAPLEEKDWSPGPRAELGRMAEALDTLGVQLGAGLEGFARWRR